MIYFYTGYSMEDFGHQLNDHKVLSDLNELERCGLAFVAVRTRTWVEKSTHYKDEYLKRDPYVVAGICSDEIYIFKGELSREPEIAGILNSPWASHGND